MAEDKREAILCRLLKIAEDQAGEGYAFRNKTEIPEDKRPGIVLLDGDESKEGVTDVAGRGRPANGPVVVEMSPELFILVEDKADKVGSTLNSWRAKLIKAITSDAPLIALCKEMRFESFTTALATGRSMEGQARLNMTFAYVLRIDKL